MEKFYNRIRDIRVARGVGLNELAREVGISGAYLCDIERGNRRGSRDVIERIADRLGVTPFDLIPTESEGC